MNLTEAIIAKLTWRSGVAHAYASALLRAALALADAGVVYFNNDDVDELDQPLDKTTVGSVFRMLMAANIIEPWRGTVATQMIWGGMRRSTRRANNGHRNQLYTLTSHGIATEWLRRCGAAPAPKQLTLLLEV